MSERTIKVLTELGLTPHEAKVYVALCIRGTATVSELSDLAGIPYTKTYDILNSLESKGLAVSLGGRPVRYRAVHPDIAIRALRERIEAEYRRKMEAFERSARLARDLLLPIFEKASASRPEALITFIKGRVSVNNFILEMLGEGDVVYAILTPASARRIQAVLQQERVRGELRPVSLAEEARCNVLVSPRRLLVYLPIPDDEDPVTGHDIGFAVGDPNVVSTFRAMMKALGGGRGRCTTS